MSETMFAIILTTISLLVGSIVTVLVSRHFKTSKNLSYVSLTSTFLNLDGDRNVEKISASYDDIQIRNLHRSFVLIFNPNESPIRGTEISSAARLRYSLPEGASILEIKPSVKSQSSVAPSYERDENRLLIDFDILNHRDYAAVEFYWTGVEGSFEFDEEVGSLAGTISGISRQFKRYRFFDVFANVAPKKADKILPFLMIMLIGLVSYGLNRAIVEFDVDNLLKSIFGLIFLTVLSIVVYVGVFLQMRETIASYYLRNFVFPKLPSK